MIEVTLQEARVELEPLDGLTVLRILPVGGREGLVFNVVLEAAGVTELINKLLVHDLAA